MASEVHSFDKTPSYQMNRIQIPASVNLDRFLRWVLKIPNQVRKIYEKELVFIEGLYVPGIVLSVETRRDMDHITEPSQQSYDTATVIILILEMRKQA